MSKDENPQREHFHNLILYSFMIKNKRVENRNDEKYDQSGITVKIHTNHDGVKCLGLLRLFYHGDLRS